MMRKKRSRKIFKAAHGRWVPHAVLYAVLLVVTSVLVFSTRSLRASDGSGTNSVSPTSVNAGSTGNSPIFTFTAGETMDSGGVSIVVPVNAGWSAPQGTNGVAGYVTASSPSGITANVLNTLDTATNWSAPTRMSLSADTGDKQEGSASLSNSISSAAAANDQWYFNYGAASDWGTANSTNGSRVGFWIKSSVATASGVYSWQDDDTASLASPLDTLSIQALSANTWTYASVTLGANRPSILSYGLRYTTDIGAVTVKTDSISALFDAADVTTNWTADSNITVSALSTVGNFKEGTAAIRCTYAAAAGTGVNGECYRHSTTAADMGPGTIVSYWVRSSVALSAGDFAWVDDGSNSLLSPEDTVSLPAIAANTWTYVTTTAANSANKSNRSYGLRQVVDKGAMTIDIDAMGKQIDAGDSVTGWLPVGTTQTLSSDTTTFHEGSASLRNDISAGAVAGVAWYETLGTAQNWAGYTTVGFWIRSSVNTAAGDLKFQYAASTDLSSPIASIDIGALTANTWSFQKLTLSGVRTSVRSYGINYATDIGAATINLDDVLIGPGVPTFSGGDTINVRLLSLGSGQTLGITYGSGGGASGATAPTTTGVYTFTTKSLVSDSGTLTTISAPSPTITAAPGATSQFLIDDPGNMTAGTRLGYTLTRKDAYGNLVTSGAQTVYLYSSSTSPNKAFYTASTGGSPVTSISFADGSSTAQFWYYDELVGSWGVTASDNAIAPDWSTGIDDAADTVTVSAAAISQFTVNNPGDMTAGNRLGYVVTRKDAFGNVITTGSDTVYLYSDATGANEAFYAASSGGSPIASVTIGVGTSTAQFWYYDELAGSWTVTASDNTSVPDGTTGIDDATDSVAVSAAAISQFTLNDPGNMTAGTRLGYTVTRRDAYGNIVTTGSQTVRLYNDSTGNSAFYAASSGGTPISSVLIGSGASTANFWYYDDQPGTWTITASDNATAPDGATGVDDATDSVTVDPAPTSQFTLNNPGNMTAGTRLTYVVTRKDQFNNDVLTGSDIVYVYSDSTGNKVFYDAPSGGSPITFVTISGATSTAQFWYYDDKAGSITVSASDNAGAPDGATGIDDATDAVTISADATSAFFLTDPGDMTAGTRLGYTVTRKDQFGNAVTAGSETVYLYSDSTGNKAFYTVSTGGSPITSATIADGASIKQIWYYDDKAGSVTVTASDNASSPDGTTGIDDATDAVAVSAASTRTYLLNDPGDMAAGARLGYIVTRQDQFGNVVTSGSDTVYLYSGSTGANKAFYAADTGGSPITSITIGSGASTAQFWYYDEKAGSWTITASDNASAPDGATGIDDATDNVTVITGATAQYTLDNPGDMTAGTRLGYTVTRTDAFGNLVTAGSDTVFLYSNSLDGKAFYAALSGGSPITVISIGAGSSSADFWYYDELAGSWTITASDNATTGDGATGIDDATDNVTVSAASIAAFFLNSPGDEQAGVRIGYVVTRKDAFGNPVISGSQTVHVYSDSTGNEAFYAAEVGGSPITSVLIGAGTSTKQFWYYDDQTGNVTVTASDNASAPDGATGVDDATDSITILPASTSEFVLSDPGDMTAGTRLGYTVSRKDPFGNYVTTGSDTAHLSSNSTGNKAFYDAPSGGNLITSISIGAGVSTTQFWYYDDKTGSVTVTASDNAIPDGTTGIDDDTDAVAVSAAAATQFVITDPADSTVGIAVTVTVRAMDQFGNLASTYQNDVTLNTSGSSTGAGLVDIVDGVGTKDVNDERAETVSLTLSDTQSTGLNVSSSQNVVFAAGETRQFELSDPGNMTAGTRLGYTVSRKDQYGNVVTVGNDTVYLYSNSTGNEAFYDASSGGSPIASVVIGSGTSTVNFWYYDDKAASVIVTVSDTISSPDGLTGIDDATDSVTVESDVTAVFLLSDPGDMTAGTRVGYTVTREDQFGNAVSLGSNTVYLYSDSTGNKAFYGEAVDGLAITSVTIGSGSSTAEFWYYDDKAGSFTVVASDGSTGQDGAIGINDASDVVAISAAAVSQFVLSDPGDMSVGTRLEYSVTRKDAFGNIVTTGVDTVYLYTNSIGTGAAFYDAASGGSPIVSISIPGGSSSVNVWYYDADAGAWLLTASDNASAADGTAGIDDGTDTVTVTAIPIVATRFVIVDPTDGVAGTAVTVTVRAEDDYGSVDTTIQSDVTLNVNNSATGGGHVDIVDGVGTVNVNDVIAETVHLTLSDTETTGLNVASSQDVVFATGPTAKFILTDPGDTTAGTLVQYTVSRQDAYSNLVTSGSDIVYLYSTGVSGMHRFYDAASGGSVITSINIGAGQSSVNVWYSDDKAATVTVTVADHATAPDGATGIDDATDGVVVSPGLTGTFTLSDPGDMTVGTRIGYTLTRADAYGNLVISGSDSAYLFAQPAGTSTVFYDAASAGSAVTVRTIADGSSQALFWFYTNEAGSVNVVATDNTSVPDGATGISDATDGVVASVNSIVATRFIIVDPLDGRVGDTITVTVKAVDADGDVDTSYQDDVRLNASGSATGEGMVDIVNGIGTKTISDAVAETVRLTLTDTEATGLDVSSAKSVIFSRVTQISQGGTTVAPITITAPLPQLTFSGLAYPGGRINIMVRQANADIALKQDADIEKDGLFSTDFTGAFGGGKTYGIVATDKDGRKSPVQIVTVSEDGEQMTRNLVIAPTIGFVRTTILKGENLTIVGYASPGSRVEASVDGTTLGINGTTAGKDGAYKILVETLHLEYGNHIVRTYQRSAGGAVSGSSLQKTFVISRLLNPKTDLNNDGRSDVSDWSIFLTRWNSTDPDVRKQIDLNGDGKTDVADFSIFIRSLKKRI